MRHQDFKKQNWSSVKAEIQKTWKQLNPDDLEKTKGKFSEISTLIQNNAGLKAEEVERELDDVISRCGTEVKPSSRKSSQTNRNSDFDSEAMEQSEDQDNLNSEEEFRASNVNSAHDSTDGRKRENIEMPEPQKENASSFSGVPNRDSNRESTSGVTKSGSNRENISSSKSTFQYGSKNRSSK